MRKTILKEEYIEVNYYLNKLIGKYYIIIKILVDFWTPNTSYETFFGHIGSLLLRKKLQILMGSVIIIKKWNDPLY